MEYAIAVIMPIIIDAANKWTTVEWKRFAIACLSCFIAGAAISYPSWVITTFDLQHVGPALKQLSVSFGIVFSLSQIIFKTYYKDSFVRYGFLKLIYPTTKAQAEVAPVSPPTQ